MKRCIGPGVQHVKHHLFLVQMDCLVSGEKAVSKSKKCTVWLYLVKLNTSCFLCKAKPETGQVLMKSCEEAKPVFDSLCSDLLCLWGKEQIVKGKDVLSL